MTKSYQMNLRVATLYNPGTAKILEDKFFVRPPFFGVLDGVSGLYDPAIGPRLFGGKSGGQKVIEIVESTFAHAKDSEGLEAIIKKANLLIREFCESQGIGMNRPDLLPGAAFAFVKAVEDRVEVIQGGDCFAVWEKVNGEIGATLNQNFLDGEEEIGIINSIIEKHRGDRDKAWKEFMPILARLRIEGTNKNTEKRTVVLNGQPEVESLWYKTTLPQAELKTLLLFTDGMVEFSKSRDVKEMGKIVLAAYRGGGLEGMLSRIREIERRRIHTTHIAEAEATAVAVEF